MTHVDVAVVGGGPAGLSAAISAARSGAGVMLFDENATLGGQLRYRVASVPALSQKMTPAYRLATNLIDEATVAGVELMPAKVVWGLFPGNRLSVSVAGIAQEVTAGQIVLATGSTDLAFSFAGGSLPGVINGRGLQILLHLHRILPGRRFAVLGSGTEAAEIASDIEQAGGQVVIHGDPCAGQTIAAFGKDGVTALTIDGQRYDLDVVVVAVGRQPDVELALMAECDAIYAAELGGLVPGRDGNLRTSVPGIIIAGDAAGLCDIPLALAEGRFAGISAASALGFDDGGHLERARADYLAVASERVALATSADPAPIRA